MAGSKYLTAQEIKDFKNACTLFENKLSAHEKALKESGNHIPNGLLDKIDDTFEALSTIMEF